MHSPVLRYFQVNAPHLLNLLVSKDSVWSEVRENTISTDRLAARIRESVPADRDLREACRVLMVARSRGHLPDPDK